MKRHFGVAIGFTLVLGFWVSGVQAQSVGVTLQKLNPSTLDIPRGSSKEVQYTWVVKSTTTKPLSVFVHYVNSNNVNSLGGGDHVLPTPTTSWKGTIAYKRSITIPPDAPLGTYSVKVGLYAEDTGLRYTVTPGAGVTVDGETRYLVGTFRVVEATAPPNPPRTVFVSPQGQDFNDGSLPFPVRTLAKARDMARQIRQLKPGQVTVLLRGGEYSQTQPLELGPQDSNTFWASFPGEVAIITGFKTLPKEWVKLSNNVFSLKLPIDIVFKTFYVNGVHQSISRLPEDNWWKVAPTSSTSEFNFSTGPDALKGMVSADVVLRPYEWAEQRLPLKSFDAGLKKVVLGQICPFPLALDGEPGLWALENLESGMTREGQWYCEKGVDFNTLYWLSPEGRDPNTMECRVGTLVTLINLVGTPGAWVEGVVMQDLIFRGSGARVLFASEGGDYTSFALRMTQGVRNITLQNDLFTDIGAGALGLFDLCQNVTITKCRFDRIGESAIVISGDPGPAPYHNGGHKVEQNEISHVGLRASQSYGVVVAMSQNNSIGYNYIHDAPYAGIRLSGSLYQDWQSSSSPGLSPPYDTLNIKPFIATAGNIVHHNLLTNTMQSLSDGGAIYTWGITGTVANSIEHNLIENVGGLSPYKIIGADVGIYFDDESDGYNCSYNTVLNANWGINLHGASRITLKNNITAFSRVYDIHVQPEAYSPSPYNTDILNHVFYYGPQNPWGTQWGDWSRKPLRTVENNTYWRAGGPVSMYPGQDTNSKLEDPGFMDPWLKSSVLFSPTSPARTRGNTDPDQIFWQPVRTP